jgi:hypothetical protein
MGVGIKQGDEYISSAEKANDAYGQNGFRKSSSLLPGETVSTFLPELRAKTPVNSQLNPDRANGSPIATHPFQKGAAAGPKVPGNNRPVWK